MDNRIDLIELQRALEANTAALRTATHWYRAELLRTRAKLKASIRGAA